MAYGYHEGYSFGDDIRNCPFCGAEVDSWKADGTAYCADCKKHFAVIESEGTDY